MSKWPYDHDPKLVGGLSDEDFERFLRQRSPLRFPHTRSRHFGGGKQFDQRDEMQAQESAAWLERQRLPPEPEPRDTGPETLPAPAECATEVGSDADERDSHGSPLLGLLILLVSGACTLGCVILVARAIAGVLQ